MIFIGNYKGISKTILQDVRGLKKKACIVLGTGKSIEKVKIPSGAYTIGVNNICDIFTPDSVVLPDNLSPDYDYRRSFGEEKGNVANKKRDSIVSTDSKYIFTCNTKIKFPNTQFVYVRNGNISTSTEAMQKCLAAHYLWSHCTSIFNAICLAVIFGFRHIGFIGCDLITHPVLKENQYIETINNAMRLVLLFLSHKGIGLENLSKESRVISVPKTTMSDFCRNYL